MSSIDSSPGRDVSDIGPVRSERRGGHGVAWIAVEGSAGPADSVLIVGQDQTEAEDRCRKWWADRPEPAGGPPTNPRPLD